MAFKDTYRLEKVYYENMWTLLKSLKALKENPSADTLATVNELLDNAIADNESIILIYKNLGELYAEVAQKFVDLLTDLKAIRDDLEMWKNEINEKIDDVNNYLMGHIRDLDDRVTSLEGRVSDLEDRMTTAENDIDALEGRMETAEGDIDALEGRMDTAEGDIDALEGRMDTAEDDIDALEGRMDTAEDDIDSLEGRMDTAEDDIDDLETNKQDKLTAGNGITIDSNNEISVDTSVVQPKLTEGFGVDIDSNNEISVDTNDVQEKLIAGQNITLTPDTTDPTKTVIDAQGGESYTAGEAITIENNAISAREVGIFEDFGTAFIASQNYTFALNTSRADTRLELSHDIGNAITYNNLITKIDKYDSMYFSLASANTSFLQAINEPLNYILYRAIVSIKDTTDNREAVLQRSDSTSFLLQHIKNDGDTIASSAKIRIDGIKKLKRWLTAGHSYKFHLEAYACVHSSDGLLAKTDYISIVGTSTSLTLPISAYGLA